MAKTGTELQDSQLGDMKSLESETSYAPRVVGLRVSLVYDYAIPSPVEPDDGKRTKGLVATLSESDFSTLSKTVQDAIIALAESK